MTVKKLNIVKKSGKNHQYRWFWGYIYIKNKKIGKKIMGNLVINYGNLVINYGNLVIHYGNLVINY